MMLTPRAVSTPWGSLDAAWLGAAPSQAPSWVLLHDGLGSLGLWREFPRALGRATGWGVLVYSRLGHGRSDPCRLPRPTTFMHDEATGVLPLVLRAWGVERHVLLGHSDGGSIALIHAAVTPQPGLLGVATEAAHVFCEDATVSAIDRATKEFDAGDLRSRLARHHGANVDVCFRGWAEAWLHPDFRAWDLRALLPRVGVPVLALQGAADDYGTPAQLSAIGCLTGAETVLMPACGHTPHRDRPQEVLDALARFARSLRPEA